MNIRTIVFLLLLSPMSLTAAPGPEYNINVHVVSSYVVDAPARFGGSVGVQKVNVLIDGKKYELSADVAKHGLLALGDYKARLIADEHKKPYESSQTYEFMFPDKTIRKFYLTGQSE